MRITENDLRAHGNQLVDEEESGLEHLLVHHDQPVALSGCHDGDRHRVRGECRPRLVLELRYMVAHVRLNLECLLRRNDQILSVYLALDSKALETHSRRSQMLDACILDAQLGMCHRGKPDE